jgi:hypothetical protein
MKTIKEYINDEYNISIDRGCYAEYEYENIKDISDLYYETLKTHDTDLLIKKLNDIYENDISCIKYNGEDKCSFYIVLNNKIDTNKLNDILFFYNYINSFERKINNKIHYFIEPFYPKDISKDIFEKHLSIYHFTNKRNIDSILKNGLRCKKNTYRDFPERIYLYVTDKKINDDKDNVLKFIDKVLRTTKDVAIIKIKNIHNIPIYNDTAMMEDNACFTYNNIDKSQIELLNIDLE